MKLEINKLAKEIEKYPVDTTLPNGKVVSGIVWEGSDLPRLSKLLHNCNKDEVVELDGRMPAWLACSLVHECHPSLVKINTPIGMLPVGCKTPKGEGKGFHLSFSVKEEENGWTTVMVAQKDPAIPLDLGKVGEIVPPELPMGSKVIISGRMPLIVFASLAMAYHGICQAVAVYQPQLHGAMVVITHHPKVLLGSIIAA